ncbi:hypothetical protein SAMN02745129_4484 [Ferrimonas marina]|uniref:Uncharacterized protein n=1 Tax=Ferrimonas marina TaxID=299255 RepID=A0A1M5YUG9_9GAMM|nr:hypothetical protein SAMN02745129_4484 [Ferrimonas marina]
MIDALLLCMLAIPLTWLLRPFFSTAWAFIVDAIERRFSEKIDD